jgi:hypothetical protein
VFRRATSGGAVPVSDLGAFDEDNDVATAQNNKNNNNNNNNNDNNNNDNDRRVRRAVPAPHPPHVPGQAIFSNLLKIARKFVLHLKI